MTRVAAIGELSSRSVQLRPLLPSDGEWCYALVCGPSGQHWKYRGRTPSHEQVAVDLWRGVFAQFVVVDRGTGERAGLVGFYDVAPAAGRAYVFALAEPSAAARVTEGLGLLCRWGFEHHGFQRLFVEAAEFNLQQFTSLGEAAVVEGRLRNHEFWRGRYWDLFILSITPEVFGARYDALLAERCRDTVTPDRLDAATYSALVDELWPLDSLGLVEVLDALERVVGAPVDVGCVARIAATTPADWAAASLDTATDAAR